MPEWRLQDPGCLGQQGFDAPLLCAFPLGPWSSRSRSRNPAPRGALTLPESLGQEALPRTAVQRQIRLETSAALAICPVPRLGPTCTFRRVAYKSAAFFKKSMHGSWRKTFEIFLGGLRCFQWHLATLGQPKSCSILNERGNTLWEFTIIRDPWIAPKRIESLQRDPQKGHRYCRKAPCSRNSAGCAGNPSKKRDPPRIRAGVSGVCSGSFCPGQTHLKPTVGVVMYVMLEG